MKAKLSLYGSVSIPKIWCSDCECDSFLIDGKVRCCGREKNDVEGIKGVRRESQSERLNLTENFKKRIFELQRGHCYLCGIDLTIRHYVLKKNRPILIRPEYDHFIPRSYCVVNDSQNIFLMCNVCNSVKSNLMFETKAEAIKFVMKKRSLHGTLNTYSDFEIEILTSSDTQIR